MKTTIKQLPLKTQITIIWKLFNMGEINDNYCIINKNLPLIEYPVLLKKGPGKIYNIVHDTL